MDRVIDQWAGLNHKALMRDSATATVPGPATWIPRDEFRRINAYRILSGYRLNAAKEFVEATDETERLFRREYGDADLFVRQTAAAIIGRGAALQVAGSNRPPEDPPEDAPQSVIDEFNRVKAAYGAIVQRQAEVDQWARDEQWSLRVNSGEEDATGLGDGIYWLTFSAKRNRVRLRTLDPGFYFPVYAPDGDADDYPTKIHLAWEYEERKPDVFGSGNVVRWLRRITYELVETEQPYSVPYSKDPVTQVCLLSDARWDMGNMTGTALDLDIGQAVFNVNDDGELMDELDLGIDFIPVVHVPNMGGDPWGTSLLTGIAQVLDDMQIADTDAVDAASVAGGPPIVLMGASASGPVKHYGPKTLWEVPVGGGASVLDTSKGLASLHDQQDKLFARASTNARVPEEVLGKVSAADVPSGLALSLSFGPFEVMIEQARLVRGFKYELLLKMVQRLHIAYGVWKGDVFPAGVEFGSALPSDFGALTEILNKLTGNDKALMSRATAVSVLRNAGMPIPDVSVEVDRIRGEDYAGANLLYRATRSPAIAATYLGEDLPEDVLMEQLGKFLARDVRLDEVRALFDAHKAAEDAQKVLDAEAASKRMDAAKVSATPPSGGGGNGRGKPGVN